MSLRPQAAVAFADALTHLAELFRAAAEAESPRAWLTVEEASAEFGVPVYTIRQWIRRKEIAHAVTGKKKAWRLERCEVERVLRLRTVHPARQLREVVAR